MFLLYNLRPSLGKKVFPVCRVAQKAASRDLFFPNIIFHQLECTGGGGGVKIYFFENMKKKSWPFLAHSGGGQETPFYLRVALLKGYLFQRFDHKECFTMYDPPIISAEKPYM